MKQVRYLAGAAGLAPMAIAFMPLAGATQPAAADGSAGNPKTVSLQHSGMNVVPNNSCTASDSYTIPQYNHVRGHGWVKQNGARWCVGTVVVSLYFTKGSPNHLFCKSAEAAPLPDGVGTFGLSYWQNVCGYAGHWFAVNIGIHRSFSASFMGMCANSIYNNGGSGSACIKHIRT